jgi:hypothetical protein
MHLLKAERGRLLPGLLDEVLRELARGRIDRGPDGVCDDPSPDRYEDEEYIYIEADLAHDPGGFIDICIQGGRAFIRMTRTPCVHRGDGDGADQ